MPFQVAVRFVRYAARVPVWNLAVDDVNAAELLPLQPVVPNSKPGLVKRFCAVSLLAQSINTKIITQARPA